jgi:hypothetical protein
MPIHIAPNILQRIQYKLILQYANQLLPFPFNNIVFPTFRSNSSPPLSIFLDNTIDTSESINQSYLNQHKNCECNLEIYKPFTNSYGHIDTNNTNIINITLTNKLWQKEKIQLQTLMEYGRNHRTQQLPSKTQMMQLFDNTLTNYINKIINTYPLDDSLFTKWKLYIMEQLKNTINTLILPTESLHIAEPNMKKLIKFLHTRYTIGGTDKLKNNFRITCKHHYILRLHKLITKHDINLSNPTYPIQMHPTPQSGYTVITKTQETIIKEHTAFLQP